MMSKIVVWDCSVVVASAGSTAVDVVVTLLSIAIFIVVVVSSTISEGFKVVVGRVSVEVTATFVDISMIISGGTVVTVESIAISVVMSGNIRDSGGNVVVIIFVV